LVRDENQPLRIGHRQRSQQHAIDHGENGSIGSDSHSKRQRGRYGEQRSLAQLPEGVAHVLQEPLEKRQPLLIPIAFLDGFNPAELEHGVAPGLDGR
jgi:hypothetical protein